MLHLNKMQTWVSHASLKGFNTLTFHSLSTRDNLRVFIVAERPNMGVGQGARSDVDAERDDE